MKKRKYPQFGRGGGRIRIRRIEKMPEISRSHAIGTLSKRMEAQDRGKAGARRKKKEQETKRIRGGTAVGEAASCFHQGRRRGGSRPPRITSNLDEVSNRLWERFSSREGFRFRRMHLSRRDIVLKKGPKRNGETIGKIQPFSSRAGLGRSFLGAVGKGAQKHSFWKRRARAVFTSGWNWLNSNATASIAF